MPTFELPDLLDPTKYTLGLTSGSYVSLVSETLGNAATPSDGFDATMTRLMARTAVGIRDVSAADTDITAAGEVFKGLVTNDAADLASQLAGPGAAIDAALSGFTATLPPAPNSGGTTSPPPATGPYSGGTPAGTVIGGLTVGSADPAPYPAVPGNPAADGTISVPVLATDNLKQTITIGNGSFGPVQMANGASDLAQFGFGDRAIFGFSEKITVRGNGGESWEATATITPAKPGRFSAMFYTPGRVISGGQGVGAMLGYQEPDKLTQVNVTIVAAPATKKGVILRANPITP